MKIQMSQRVIALKNDVLVNVANPSNFKMAMSMLTVMMLVVVAVLAFIPTGLADGVSDIKTIAQKIYGMIVGISTALAVVGEAIAACMYFFSSNGKAVEAASGWMKRIAIGWVFINGMGILVSLVGSMGILGHSWQGQDPTAPTAPTRT